MELETPQARIHRLAHDMARHYRRLRELVSAGCGEAQQARDVADHARDLANAAELLATELEVAGMMDRPMGKFCEDTTADQV